MLSFYASQEFLSKIDDKNLYNNRYILKYVKSEIEISLVQKKVLL